MDAAQWTKWFKDMYGIKVRGECSAVLMRVAGGVQRLVTGREMRLRLTR